MKTIELIENHFIYENLSNRKIKITIESLDGIGLGEEDFVITIGDGGDYHLHIPTATQKFVNILKDALDENKNI